MASNKKAKTSRLGRPPSSDSAETKRRILDASRAVFAVQGYEVATNRSLAGAAGITSGALYYYFGSKLELYVAIYQDVQTFISERFGEAIADRPTFVERLHAVLDESHQLNIEDRTLARFLGAARVDRTRHPEIDAAILKVEVGKEFFRDLVDFGVKSGEIHKKRRRLVLVYLETVLTGLTDAVSGDDDRHAVAVESVKLSMRGALLAD